MIENLIDFYTNELSFYSLVTKKVNRYIHILVIFLLFICFAGLVWFLFVECILGSVLIMVLVFIILCYYGKIINAKKNELFEPTEHKSSNFVFQEYIFKKLRDYLKHENSRMNINFLKPIIKEKMQEGKTNFLIFTSIFSVLLVSIWNSFVSVLITEAKGNILVIILLIMIAIMIAYLVYILQKISDMFFSNYIKLKRLYDLLTEYELNLILNKD